MIKSKSIDDRFLIKCRWMDGKYHVQIVTESQNLVYNIFICYTTTIYIYNFFSNSVIILPLTCSFLIVPVLKEGKKRISLSPAKSWFSFFHSSNTEKDDKQTSSVQSENVRNANHSSLLNLTNNDTSVTDIDSESSTEPVSIWRFAAVSAGFMTCASIFGLALILEAEVHSPIMATIRGHPWFLDFDSRFYRPMRSALLGFWRR